MRELKTFYGTCRSGGRNSMEGNWERTPIQAYDIFSAYSIAKGIFGEENVMNDFSPYA